VINPKVNYSKILTRHTLKLGWELQTIHTEVLDFQPAVWAGQLTAASSALPPGASANNIFTNVADFLFGARSAYELTNTFVAQYRQRMSFYYLQDDWKVNSKLTVNLGVRYEYGTAAIRGWQSPLQLRPDRQEADPGLQRRHVPTLAG